MKITSSLEEQLALITSEPTCFVGIGNTLRSDDAIGVSIVNDVAQDPYILQNPSLVQIINVEDVLENYVYKIAETKTKNIILIDAVRDIGNNLKVGDVYLQRLENLEVSDINNFSTHKLAFAISEKIFRAHQKTTYILGIAVANTDFGKTVTPEVASAGAKLCATIINLYKRIKPIVGVSQ